MSKDKKSVLVVLNYYYPYISGVSEYARLLAEKFVLEGYDVTVIASNHAGLALEENINGVKVIRTKVLFKISKGVISPEYIWKVIKLSKHFDIVHLHLPMIESGVIAQFVPARKLVATYQCDVNLPKGLFNNIIVKVMDITNGYCLKKAKKIMVTSKDYALKSRIAFRYEKKLMEAGAPIKEYYPERTLEKVKFRDIGFCGRIVEEKGINVLLEAYELLKNKYPDIRLVIGGDYKNIAGGSVYLDLKKQIETRVIKDVKFLGAIPEAEMASFYSSLAVMTLPSINSLEAFGMVQVEAMLCGIPVVASDLPGVRTIVQNTGMGEIAKRGNSEDLARKIEMVLDNREQYIKPRDVIVNLYGMETVYRKYRDAYFEDDEI